MLKNPILIIQINDFKFIYVFFRIGLVMAVNIMENEIIKWEIYWVRNAMRDITLFENKTLRLSTLT